MRIVDVLIQVQAPHDRIIFDRLCEWIKTSHPNKHHALNLFGHFVRKQPLWLHTVASHPLIKELMKLLRVRFFSKHTIQTFYN